MADANTTAAPAVAATVADNPYRVPKGGFDALWINRLPVPSKRVEIGADGLLLRLEPSGSRTFYRKCRTGNVRIGRWSFHPVPGHITLREAWRWERELREAEALGPEHFAQTKDRMRKAIDVAPVLKPSEVTGDKTFRAAFEAFFEAKVLRGRLKTKNPKEARRRMERILAAIGADRPVLDVTTEVCTAYLNERAKQAPVHSIKEFRMLRRALIYARKQTWIPRSPLADFDADDFGFESSEEWDRSLAEAEIPLVWNGLDQSRRLDIVTRCALRFLLVIPCRTSELLLAERREVDFDAKEWTIPIEHQKLTQEQAKFASPLVHPLPPLALDLLRTMFTAGGDSRFVCASASEDGHLDEKTLGRAMRRTFGTATPCPRCGPPKGKRPVILPGDPDKARRHGFDPPTPHDLRRTFGSRGPKVGISDEALKKCMAHSFGRIGRTYYRNTETYLEQRRDALTKWAAYIAQLVGWTESSGVTPCVCGKGTPVAASQAGRELRYCPECDRERQEKQRERMRKYMRVRRAKKKAKA